MEESINNSIFCNNKFMYLLNSKSSYYYNTPYTIRSKFSTSSSLSRFLIKSHRNALIRW